MPVAFLNPFRPGAGHPPPYLAGRISERAEFARLLKQSPILNNPLLTGLRGVGKTVLLESLRPRAREAGWLWVGSDVSEAVSASEDGLAIRLCTDLALITSGIEVAAGPKRAVGFSPAAVAASEPLDYVRLVRIYEETPGLPLDRIKRVLSASWRAISDARPDARGIVFAYDEAQNLVNQPRREQYPLSLLLDAFQSLQRQAMPLMLALSGLPTLFPAMVRARTSAERMFRVLFLDRLNAQESAEAILRPIANSPIRLTPDSVRRIIEMSGGYPYFIQFIGKEIYDAFIQRGKEGGPPVAPVTDIVRKLDTDFFAGRWARTTDRQRDLLWAIAHLDGAGEEFTVRSVVAKAKTMLERPFSSSHASQMLSNLASQGLIFRNRHGRHAFAVPLLDQFIRRQPPPDGALRQTATSGD